VNDTQKILIFEYITGGGLAQQDLPTSLAKEGQLMLTKLMDELKDIRAIELTILLDWRFKELVKGRFKRVDVSAQQSVFDLLPSLIEQHDSAWLIAPESHHTLQKLAVLVEAQSKQLLNASSDAIGLCADKRATINLLNSHNIKTVETLPLASFVWSNNPWVIKPNCAEGGCGQFKVISKTDYQQVVKQIPVLSGFIIQPYIAGESLSLSCLFYHGQARLLCCNRQHFSLTQGFHLTACEVNIRTDRNDEYQALINKIATLIPGLWGYVGIDLIQPKWAEAVILEINPRLTTSYVGVGQALGLNIAQMVIDMMKSTPVFSIKQNRTVWVEI